MRRGWTGLLLALSLAAGACGGEEPAEPQAAAAIPVRVTVARTGRMQESFEAGGVVRPRMATTLSSRIVAPVVEVRVAAGSRVRAGQTLVRLDARQPDAARAGAEATLGSLLEGAGAAAAEGQAAEAALTLAATSHARIAKLSERNVATQGELDEAVAALRAAEARAKASSARMKEADRAIDAAQEAARAAAVMATYAVITAPFDGIVSGRMVDPGTLATPGLPLVTVEDTSRFRLEVSVDAARAGAIAVGSRVPITLAGVDASIDGTVSEISPSLDAVAHAFIVKVDLPPHPALRSGVFGRARFAGVERAMLTVPAGAVVRRGQLTIVYIDDNGTARMRFVRVGEYGADMVAILAGVSEGERVVADPPAHLRDGSAVTALAGSAPRERKP